MVLSSGAIAVLAIPPAIAPERREVIIMMIDLAYISKYARGKKGLAVNIYLFRFNLIQIYFSDLSVLCSAELTWRVEFNRFVAV